MVNEILSVVKFAHPLRNQYTIRITYCSVADTYTYTHTHTNTHTHTYIYIYIKVKNSLYIPEQVLRVPEGCILKTTGARW